MAVRRDESKGTRVFAEERPKVWQALRVTVSESGDTIVSEDKERGIILTGYDNMSVEDLKKISKMPPKRISSSFERVWLYARHKVDYTVKSVSESETVVKALVYLQAYNASGQRWINVFSNGAKEKEILDKIQAYLERPVS